MMTVNRRTYLLAVHVKLAKMAYSHFGFHPEGCGGYLEGEMRPSQGHVKYVIRLVLPPCSPDVRPELLVWNPVRLRKRGWGSVNDAGCSHSFHTRSTGSGGRVRICHTPGPWDASRTYVQVLCKAYLWLEAYHGYLATGYPISSYFARSEKVQ